MSTNESTTLINHELRKEFGLSFSDYCVLDKIVNNNVNGWTDIDVSKITKEIGVSKATVYNALCLLQEKDLIKKSSKNDKLYKPTMLYEKCFIF